MYSKYLQTSQVRQKTIQCYSYTSYTLEKLNLKSSCPIKKTILDTIYNDHYNKKVNFFTEMLNISIKNIILYK